MRKLIVIAALCLLSSLNASAQSLDKLLPRAQGYLVARAAGNKIEMSRYSPAARRKEILDRNPPLMSKAHMEGFEFTDDPKTVYVVYSATVSLKDVGDVPVQIREAWNWDGKDWFLVIKDNENPFLITKNAPPAPPPAVAFELGASKIDFGKHVQGEILTRTIPFKADRDRISAVRMAREDFKGLTVGGLRWSSQDAGELEVSLDTTLLSEKVRYAVEIELITYQGQTGRAQFEADAEVEPRLLFSQTPEVIDPASAGTVEIRIENVSKTPFKPTSLIITNRAYEISDYTSDVISPGKTLKILVKYQAQPEPTGAVLNIQTSPGVLAQPGFILPFNVKLPFSRGAGYTKEELDEMLKRSR